MRIIDLHCDTVMRLAKGEHLDGCGGHVNIEKLRRGEVMAQCFAIFIPTNDAAREHGITCSPEEYFDMAYSAYLSELELNSGSIRPAYTAWDIESNSLSGVISAVLTVEDGVTLRGRIENLDEYYSRGVRMLALTWNYENSLGFPNSPDPRLHSLGLKTFGKEVVERMNELGMIVDVSHLSEGGFNDVADISRKPFVASHSCARALCGHSRNLTDRQLKAVADSGGVVGLNYLTSFLREISSDSIEDYNTTFDDVIRHLKHIRNVAGIESLALGSDYDGIDCTMDWTDCSGNAQLLEMLDGVFTPDEIDRICFGNALRVFKDTLE